MKRYLILHRPNVAIIAALSLLWFPVNIAATFADGSTVLEPVKGMKIEVVGLQISKPLPRVGEKDDNKFQMQQGSMFGSPGTEIHFFVTDKVRAILDIDDKASKVKCTDDKGADLSAKKEKEGSRFGFGSRAFSSREAPDNGGTIVELHQPNTPTAGASKVIVAGELVLQCGIGEVVVEQKDVALKAKTSVKAGPVEFVIESAKDEDFGDTKFAIELKSSKSFDVIKEIEFLDAAGKPIKHQNMGSASFGAFGKMTYQRTIGLAKKADKVTLRIKHYKTIETVKVPLKLEVGVGF
jgi:hypothetical protein